MLASGRRDASKRHTEMDPRRVTQNDWNAVEPSTNTAYPVVEGPITTNGGQERARSAGEPTGRTRCFVQGKPARYGNDTRAAVAAKDSRLGGEGEGSAGGPAWAHRGPPWAGAPNRGRRWWSTLEAEEIGRNLPGRTGYGCSLRLRTPAPPARMPPKMPPATAPANTDCAPLLPM